MFRYKTLITSAVVALAAPSLSPAQTFEERGAEILGNIGNEHARSGSFADYDNDGDPDLFIQGTVQAQRLLRNNTIGSGSATFTDVSVEVGLDNLDQYGRSSAWADYDGDGDVDLFLGREHSGNGDTRGDLFRNMLMEGGTGFVNFGAQTGLDDPYNHENVAWVDIDQDGDLDLLVLMFSQPHELYEQFAPGQFRPIGEETGFANPTSHAYGLAIGDYDGDRDLDIYISTCLIGNRIANTFFENQLSDTGVLRFIDVIDRTDTQFYPSSFGLQFADFDDDGDLDLYLIGAQGNPNAIWRNEGDTTFKELHFAELLDEENIDEISVGSVDEDEPEPAIAYQSSATLSAGAQAVDYDNDGDLDLFAQDQTGPIGRTLFRYDGDFRFTHVSTQEGLRTGPDEGYDSTFVDYDLDGDLDLFASTGPGLPQRFFVSYASTNGNGWLFVRLKGTKNNPSGIGAQVYATIHQGTPEERTLRRDTLLAMVGTFHQDDLPVHIGLGAAQVVDELRIVWPNGVTQVLTNVSAGQYLEVAIPSS